MHVVIHAQLVSHLYEGLRIVRFEVANIFVTEFVTRSRAGGRAARSISITPPMTVIIAAIARR